MRVLMVLVALITTPFGSTGAERDRNSRPLQSDGQISITGLTGFDVSVVVRSCDPSCSDSLNGANQRIANEQFALAA